MLNCLLLCLIKQKQILGLHTQMASQIFAEEVIVEPKEPRCDLRINSILRCFKMFCLKNKQDSRAWDTDEQRQRDWIDELDGTVSQDTMLQI